MTDDDFPDEDERLYDPLPYPEAEPYPLIDYDGTGIGALYGLGMTAAQAASLAGWNIKPRSQPE